MINFYHSEHKEFLALSPKSFYAMTEVLFKKYRTMTDTYYNNAKELSKILYNKRIDFKNDDKEFVTFSKIICTRDDKMDLIKIISKDLGLDSQKLLLSLEVHHRTMKEIENVIKTLRP